MKDLEIWKDIFGYEGIYQVSTYGNVKSVDRMLNAPHKKWKTFYPGKILKNMVGTNGYPLVTLCNNSIQKSYRIHNLVADAFIDKKLNKRCINHLDGNKINNHVSNLERCNHSENIKHAWDNNLRPKRSSLK